MFNERDLQEKRKEDARLKDWKKVEKGYQIGRFRNEKDFVGELCWLPGIPKNLNFEISENTQPNSPLKWKSFKIPNEKCH